ncbi:MAG: aminopeptidase [Lachnospiraceae bacterium]|nr:aminopeptidase [Lachnospiraceae bacterium]
MLERYELAYGRLQEIIFENAVPETFRDFFCSTGRFLLTALKGPEADNRALYEDILPEHYASSYGNPAYAAKVLGLKYGPVMSAVYAELRGIIPCVFEKKEERVCELLELFLELYCAFEDEETPTPEMVRRMLASYVMDYMEDHIAERLDETLDPEHQFAVDVIEQADLSNTDYLYAFGEFISEDTIKTAEVINALPEEVILKMASAFTEGYRTGFIKAGKPLSKKKTVGIRFELGFERVVRAAMHQFAEMGLRTTLCRAAYRLSDKRQALRIGYFGAVPNRQFDYDHRNDLALVLDKDYVSARLRQTQTAYEERKALAAAYGGPACMETFGEKPFVPAACSEAPVLSEHQQKLYVELTGQMSQITNRYIKGEERSFTIISWPVPAIGKDFEAIFEETIAINTLSSAEYDMIQQTIIDVLDKGRAVRVLGANGNRTDLTVALHALKNPARETNFENCTADVNIPVGEVFTSPHLKGTDGVLHVKGVYLNDLYYHDLALTFKDGCVADYTCANYEDEEENRRAIRDNILFRHKTLPIGELAIGTNTRAYMMARRYGIEDRMPILIAEKAGPHFAVGDTCYSFEEDVKVYNSDGKEIIARENEISAARKSDPDSAYFGCHTDITIPYDELGSLSVITAEGESILILENGRFVLPGTECLNAPLDQ